MRTGTFGQAWIFPSLQEQQYQYPWHRASTLLKTLPIFLALMTLHNSTLSLINSSSIWKVSQQFISARSCVAYPPRRASSPFGTPRRTDKRSLATRVAGRSSRSLARVALPVAPLAHSAARWRMPASNSAANSRASRSRATVPRAATLSTPSRPNLKSIRYRCESRVDVLTCSPLIIPVFTLLLMSKTRRLIQWDVAFCRNPVVHRMIFLPVYLSLAGAHYLWILTWIHGKTPNIRWLSVPE